MAKEFKMVISPDGSILTSVYNDVFDIAAVGKPEIHRATEVCFSNEDSCWIVIALRPLFAVEEILGRGFKSRADALDFEIKYLNENMEALIANTRGRASGNPT